MKILYFHQYFSTPFGPGGSRSYMMARRLVDRGHEVTMVCGATGNRHTGLTGEFQHGQRKGVVDEIRVIEFALPYSNHDSFTKRTTTFFQFAWRSARLAVTEPHDLIFATTTPLTAGIPAILAKLIRRKPFVFEVRDLWPELPRAMGVIRNPVVLSAISLLEWVSYRSADRLIGLSPGIVEGITGRGVMNQRVTMIPNGCDLDLFAAPAERWRPEGVGHDDLMAVFTGAHGLANGLGAVLDAAAELKRRNRPDIKLVLIGDGKKKPQLQARVKSESLDNVVFHPPVPKTKLVGLMAAADVGMQILANVPAFYYGTSPNKFFDYIAAGLPVLNNYPGWLAEMIKKNGCGYTVQPDDPQAFAEALIHAADHPQERQAMGERSRQLARSEFDRAKLANAFVQWLEDAVPTSAADQSAR